MDGTAVCNVKLYKNVLGLYSHGGYRGGFCE